MTATIKRKQTETGEFFFVIYSNECPVRSLQFKPTAPPGFLYNEAAAFVEAMDVARGIEAVPEATETIVYQTPTNGI
jgi:hypothetical protein